MSPLARLADLDRRWIFLGIALAVFVPYLIPGFVMPGGTVSPRTEAVFQAVEALPEGSVVLISCDFGPSSMPELQPMAIAIARHALSRNLRVLMMSVLPEGPLLAQQAIEAAAKDLGKRAGTDYANLGYKPGYTAIIKGMGIEIATAYPTDFAGKPLSELPVMRGVRNYGQIGLGVVLASGASPSAWIAFAHQEYGLKLAAGVTGVMTSDYYPYLNSGQIVGLVSGMKGAAEYETRLGSPGTAMAGMAAQAVAHLWIIITVIVGNVAFFALRGRSRGV